MSNFEPVHHIFVDFENVKDCDLEWVGARNTRLHIFFGSQQKKLDVELVGKMMQNASTVEMVHVKKSARNRPKKLKTLIPFAQSLLGRDQPESLAREAVGELEKAGLLQIDDKGTVAYP